MIRRIMLEAGLFKRIILHFISIMLFSLQNLFIIPYVSTSLAEFIDFYAVTFSPKFLSAIAPLKFITLSTFFFFCSLSKFTNPSTFFSLQNFSISNSLLLSLKRTNFSHHAEQSWCAKSCKESLETKEARCSTKQTYLGPLGFLHLGELSDNYSTGNYKGDRQNSLSQHSVPSFSLSSSHRFHLVTNSRLY